MSAPMPNPFDPNSTSPVPDVDDAGASTPAPTPDASAALSESDGVGAKPILASSPSEAVIVSVRAPVAADLNSVSDGVQVSSRQGCEAEPLLAHAPSETEGAVSRAASSDITNWDINGSENIHEIFAYARKLCREQSPDIENHRFAPNYSGMFQAAVNEEVWDGPPMFLQGGNHA